MWPKFLTNEKSSEKQKDPLEVHLVIEEAPEKKQEQSSPVVNKLWRRIQIVFCLLVLSGLMASRNLFCSKNTEMESADLPTFRANDWEAFHDYLKDFGKSYSSDELNRRFEIFVDNVRAMENEERDNPGVELGLTIFTDRSEDELKMMLLQGGDQSLSEPWQPQEGAGRYEEPVMETARPAEKDWRTTGKVTKIKDQQQCGSCWAFAVVGSVESQYSIKKNELLTLSEQELVDCDHSNNGCSGGYRPYAMRFVKSHGLERDDSYPYTAVVGKECKVQQNKTKIFINDYRMLTTNEEKIADWVSVNGPVTFGMNVVKSMYNYKNGVYHPTADQCENHSLGAHAMLIIGYGVENGLDFWWIKNSWGDRWGQNGYFKLARGVNACGLANTVVAPIIN